MIARLTDLHLNLSRRLSLTGPRAHCSMQLPKSTTTRLRGVRSSNYVVTATKWFPLLLRCAQTIGLRSQACAGYATSASARCRARRSAICARFTTSLERIGASASGGTQDYPCAPHATPSFTVRFPTQSSILCKLTDRYVRNARPTAPTSCGAHDRGASASRQSRNRMRAADDPRCTRRVLLSGMPYFLAERTRYPKLAFLDSCGCRSARRT